ncbi:MAG: M56 family metallopeptidase [Bacteroidota bacterium]
MIQYLIVSALLSILGVGLYLTLIRNRTSYAIQKGFLYLSILSSLILPAFFQPVLQPHPTVKAFGLGSHIPQEHLQDFCQCKNPDYSHRVMYQANGFYNWFFAHKIWFRAALGLAISLVFLRLILQIWYLKRLVRRSPHHWVPFGEDGFFLLFPDQDLSIGAFSLGKNFVIWQEQLAQLSESEKNAVFRHELSHLKQFNTLEKGLLRMLQCFWFANPAFYFFRKELDLLSECIADQAGAQEMPNPQSYARLLLSLKSGQNPMLVQGIGGSILKKRVSRLLRKRPVSSSIPWMAFPLLLILQIVIASPLSAQVSDTLKQFQTYETIYHKIDPGTEEAVYCQDCETVCRPGE